MSFRLKLFIFSALIGILPTLVLGWLWFSSMEKSLQQKTFDELTSINQLSSDLLQEWTTGSITLLESLAQRPLVIKNIQTFLSADDADLAAIHKDLDHNHFAPALNMRGNLQNLSIIDLSGKLLMSSEHQFIGQIRDQDPYFLEGQKHSYVGNVSYSASSGAAVIHVATPIRSVMGETIAVLAGQLNWDRASQLLGLVANESESLESYLVNRYHFMLTDSRFIAEAPLRVMVTTDGFQSALVSGKGQGIYQDYRGIEVIGVYRWLPELDIALLTEMGTEELNAPLGQLQYQLYIILSAIILTAIIVAYFLARILGRPVATLIAGVDELAQGKLDSRFTEIDNDLGPAKLALNEMAAQLQDTIATRDKFNHQLVGANKELEAFAYSVSHDLRAPLRAIDGFSSALVEDYLGQLDEKAQSYLFRLRQGAQEMGGLIDDLLTLSRSTRGEVNLSRVNVSGVAQTICDRLCAAAPERAVEVNIVPDIYAWCDQRLLGIALENLLGNAWKYTSKKETAIISLTPIEQNETTVEICVQDNGAGFNNRYADKLFEPFQRLHRKDEFPGSGIGLSTVQRIVQRLGGTIRGEGVVEQGARFYMTLQQKGRADG